MSTLLTRAFYILTCSSHHFISTCRAMHSNDTLPDIKATSKQRTKPYLHFASDSCHTSPYWECNPPVYFEQANYSFFFLVFAWNNASISSLFQCYRLLPYCSIVSAMQSLQQSDFNSTPNSKLSKYLLFSLSLFFSHTQAMWSKMLTSHENS